MDQIVPPNQAGVTAHADIMDSLDLFAREEMPESMSVTPVIKTWVLAGEIEPQKPT